MKRKALSKGYLLVGLAALLWASSGVVGKLLMEQGMALRDLVQARATLSAIVLGILLGVSEKGTFRVRFCHLPQLCGLGLLMALNNLTYFYSISKIQVAAAILLQYMAPILVALYATFLGIERMNRLRALALLMAVGGCYLVVGGYNVRILELNREGVLGGMGAALCFAAYTLIGERNTQSYSPWTVLFYAMAFSAVFWNLILKPLSWIGAKLQTEQWAGILQVSIMGTVVPFGLYLMGVKRIRSTRAIITATLEPISAGILSLVILGESMEPLQGVGGALVLGGIAVLQRERERQGQSPP